MCSWMKPLEVRDADDHLTRKLGYPVSETLRKILELAMSPEEARLLVEMPGTIESLAQKVDRDPKRVGDQLANRLNEIGVKVIGTIPMDNDIFESCLKGLPLKGRIATREVTKILDFLYP